MQETELEQRLRGWRLATAEIIYYMPDHPTLLQSFVWQTLDLPPKFPRIQRFLNHWRANIDAVINRIQIASAEGIEMSKFECVHWIELDGAVGGTETGVGGTETGVQRLIAPLS